MSGSRISDMLASTALPNGAIVPFVAPNGEGGLNPGTNYAYDLGNALGIRAVRCDSTNALKALDYSANPLAIFDSVVFSWVSENFNGQADDVNIIASNNALITAGAWIRDLSSGWALLSQIPLLTVQGNSLRIAGTAAVGDAGAGMVLVYDAAVDAAYVTANPTTSVRDAAGRGFRRADPLRADLAQATGAALVSFKQSDSGASAISIAAALSQALNVEDFRYDSAGAARTDTATISAALTAWQARGGGILRFGYGKTYNLGNIGIAATTIFAVSSGLTNALLDGNGATITCATYLGTSGTDTPIYNVFLFANFNQVRVENLVCKDTGAVRNAVLGAKWFVLQAGSQDCNGFSLRVRVDGGLAGLECSGPATPYRIRGVDLTGLSCRNVYYPANFQNQGDDVIGSFTSENAVRAWFGYGVTNHRLDISVTDDGNSLAEACILVKRYTRNTRNINIRASFRGTLYTTETLAKIEHQNDDGSASIIENVRLDINVDQDATDRYGCARLTFKSYTASGTLNTGSVAHVTRNVSIAGNAGSAPTWAFTAATTSASTTVTPTLATGVALADVFAVGMKISGAGIPAGARITALSSTTFTISAAATATASSVTLQREMFYTRTYYTPATEVGIGVDPSLSFGVWRTNCYDGFFFKPAADRQVRYRRGSLTASQLRADIGVPLAGQTIKLRSRWYAHGSEANNTTTKDDTEREDGIDLYADASGAITLGTAPSNGTAYTTGTAPTVTYGASGTELRLDTAGSGYNLADSFMRWELQFTSRQ